MKPRQRKAVRVSFELFEVERAVDGARQILEQLERDGATNDETLTPTVAARSILSLATFRLRDLGRALRGEFDPSLLWTERNAAGVIDGDESDALLLPWPDERKRQP